MSYLHCTKAILKPSLPIVYSSRTFTVQNLVVHSHFISDKKWLIAEVYLDGARQGLMPEDPLICPGNSLTHRGDMVNEKCTF